MNNFNGIKWQFFIKKRAHQQHNHLATCSCYNARPELNNRFPGALLAAFSLALTSQQADDLLDISVLQIQI
jgi:hypothetical protein